MGTKNIFQRLKNGLLGYRTSHEEIPAIQESIEQYRGRSDAPLLWVDGIRKVQLWQYDGDWIPFDKYCYVHGYNQYVEKDCIALWHRFHMPDPHDIGNLDLHSRMRVLADILPSRQPDEADIQAALAFWAALEASMYSMVWDNLYKYYDQDRRYFHIVEHYLKSQYDLELNRSDGYNAKTWLVTWYIAGCPAITQHNSYGVAIDKVVKVIEDWSTIGTGIPMFPPIDLGPCCDFPQELTPGVMALYDHHCRFKEKEPVMVDKSVTLVLLERVATSIAPAQWHVAIDGKHYPVKLGGIPEALDAFTKPFYKFTSDRPEGENICKVLIASGTDGHYWTFVINETYDILAIWDNDEEPMLGVTIPVDSKALSLFRIDCSLKSVL